MKIGGATVSGTSYAGGGLYVEGKIHQTHPVAATSVNACTVVLQTGSITAALASTANQTTAGSALAGTSMTANLPAGHTEVTTMFGTFGANTNTKRIIVKLQFQGTTIFDSGDITQNGGSWKLVVSRQSLTANNAVLFIEFFSTQTGTMLVNAVYNVTSYTPTNVYVAGVAVGDVTCSFYNNIITQTY